MKTKLLAGAALAALFAASGARAAQPDGFYAAVDAGWHMEDNGGVHTHSSGSAPDGQPFGYKWSYDDRYAGFARLGYQIDPHVRVELEGGFRDGKIASIQGAATRLPSTLCTVGAAQNPQCGHAGGHMDNYSAMVNGIYDILPDSIIDPFVGVGVGVSHLKVGASGQFSSVPGRITAGNPAQQTLNVDDSDNAFAYQGLAGLTYHATHRLSVDLTYRFFRTADHKWASTNGATASTLQPGTFRGHYEDQALSIGLRWNFGPDHVAAPPPPPPPPPADVPPPPPAEVAPPPAPATAEARQFVVYFPFDQSILTTDAQSVVQAAANYAMQGNATRIVVVGHTDTSGSTRYNLRLSERRGKTVADALVGLGVNQANLAVDWKGEGDLAVATPDGVKEPLNRRATIDINFQ